MTDPAPNSTIPAATPALDGLPGSPAALALLWLATVFAQFALQFVDGATYAHVSAALAPGSLMVLSAVVAGVLLGDRAPTARLIGFALLFLLVVSLIRAVAVAILGVLPEAVERLHLFEAFCALLFLPAGVLALRKLAPMWRTVASASAMALALFAATSWPDTRHGIERALDPLFASNAARLPRSLVYEVAPDQLFDSQQALVDREVDANRAPFNATDTLVLGIAADGSQELFAREAGEALGRIEGRYGARHTSGLLLSNTENDLLRTPLATRANLVRTLAKFTAGRDPSKTTAIVYIAGHGAMNATVATRLPTDDELRPINASFLAKALDEAGIGKRIVIVSACFGGSWIPALANRETIVMAAAAPDRTSFGCDDTRRLTIFGQAMLEGPLAKGAPWQQVFAAARNFVAHEEARLNVEPSDPQSYVGKDMQAVWSEPAKVK
ncbi:C13 family peptidase [Tsuneonella mangrovi]|uniref:C13 family peptidase n=1 Tax=Tsuneonella mangrovi TaxID=1982042 RepID=UPI0014711FB4|nr:C13 family peptidase [Tsuneonella mangrovi]